jgi:hypothetical protein
MYLYRNFIFMENQLALNVKTVPAWDYDMMCPHTAYTISAVVDGKLTFASGWTLKDAIELYSSIYHCNKEILKILRPFKRQLLKPFPIPPL